MGVYHIFGVHLNTHKRFQGSTLLRALSLMFFFLLSSPFGLESSHSTFRI